VSDINPTAIMKVHSPHRREHVCGHNGGGVIWRADREGLDGPCQTYRLAEALVAEQGKVKSWRESHAECERQYGQLLDEYNALVDQSETAGSI
jgi:hypothetical protein